MNTSKLAFLSLALTLISAPAFASSYDLEVESDPDSREIILVFRTKKTMSKRCGIPVEKLQVDRANMRGVGQIDIKTGPVKGKCMMALGKHQGLVKLSSSSLTTGKYRVMIDGEDNGTVRLAGRLKNAK